MHRQAGCRSYLVSGTCACEATKAHETRVHCRPFPWPCTTPPSGHSAQHRPQSPSDAAARRASIWSASPAGVPAPAMAAAAARARAAAVPCGSGVVSATASASSSKCNLRRVAPAASSRDRRRLPAGRGGRGAGCGAPSGGAVEVQVAALLVDQFRFHPLAQKSPIPCRTPSDPPVHSTNITGSPCSDHTAHSSQPQRHGLEPYCPATALSHTAQPRPRATPPSHNPQRQQRPAPPITLPRRPTP